MKAFADYNPIAIFFYFFAVISVAMFSMNPIILSLSLAGALSLFLIRNKTKHILSHLYFLLMFIMLSFVNPIFSHNGVTVLFVINNTPVTLEAMLYGVASSATIISAIYWFRSFSQIMTSDRILYLFGKVSPKIALILSMALRYIPLFGNQAKKVNQTQRALGLYKDDNAIDSIHGGIRVFSVMVTWALENGIITADSMTACGYGIGRRTFFSLYHFKRPDALMFALTSILLSVTLCGMALGVLDFEFYPRISSKSLSIMSVTSYVSYAILSFLPAAIETEVNFKWQCLKSKI